MLEAKETVIHANDSQKLGPRGAQRSLGDGKKMSGYCMFQRRTKNKGFFFFFFFFSSVKASAKFAGLDGFVLHVGQEDMEARRGGVNW